MTKTNRKKTAWIIVAAILLGALVVASFNFNRIGNTTLAGAVHAGMLEPFGIYEAQLDNDRPFFRDWFSCAGGQEHWANGKDRHKNDVRVKLCLYELPNGTYMISSLQISIKPPRK